MGEPPLSLEYHFMTISDNQVVVQDEPPQLQARMTEWMVSNKSQKIECSSQQWCEEIRSTCTGLYGMKVLEKLSHQKIWCDAWAFGDDQERRRRDHVPS